MFDETAPQIQPPGKKAGVDYFIEGKPEELEAWVKEGRVLSTRLDEIFNSLRAGINALATTIKSLDPGPEILHLTEKTESSLGETLDSMKVNPFAIASGFLIKSLFKEDLPDEVHSKIASIQALFGSTYGRNGGNLMNEYASLKTIINFWLQLMHENNILSGKLTIEQSLTLLCRELTDLLELLLNQAKGDQAVFPPPVQLMSMHDALGVESFNSNFEETQEIIQSFIEEFPDLVEEIRNENQTDTEQGEN